MFEGMFKPDHKFMELGITFLEIIGHECDCGACQQNKEMAFSCLMLLFAEATTLPVKLRPETRSMIPPPIQAAIKKTFGKKADEPQEKHSPKDLFGKEQGRPAPKPELPEFVKEIIRAALESGDITPEEQAFIHGWMESNGVEL